MSESSSSHFFSQTLPVHYSGKFEGSFPYLTIKDRLPKILVKVIDSLCRNRKTIAEIYGEIVLEDCKDVIGRLSALQNEMVTNKPIKPICDNYDDAFLWNEYLQKQEELYKTTPTWFDSSWLYSECYFYRRIKQAFNLSSSLKNYDPFHKEKEDSFISTLDTVLVLCCALNETLIELKTCSDNSAVFNLFRKYVEVALWGNKYDLSITAGKENLQLSTPLSKFEEKRKNIIANQTEDVYQLLLDVKKHKNVVIVDYVLDNAGFELFSDICLMLFLLASNLVTNINIHAKTMPWFISDTLKKDIDWLLLTLSQSSHEQLVQFSQQCSARIDSGELAIINEKFWTLPHDYSEMQSVDPQLYQKLSKSDLVIFKGDLNYRKLAGDRQWEETTSFQQALNGFLPTNIVTLRTVKADVIVGLEKGSSETLLKVSKNWKYSGDYAIIQYCLKKNSL